MYKSCVHKTDKILHKVISPQVTAVDHPPPILCVACCRHSGVLAANSCNLLHHPKRSVHHLLSVTASAPHKVRCQQVFVLAWCACIVRAWWQRFPSPWPIGTLHLAWQPGHFLAPRSCRIVRQATEGLHKAFQGLINRMWSRFPTLRSVNWVRWWGLISTVLILVEHDGFGWPMKLNAGQRCCSHRIRVAFTGRATREITTKFSDLRIN